MSPVPATFCRPATFCSQCERDLKRLPFCLRITPLKHFACRDTSDGGNGVISSADFRSRHPGADDRGRPANNDDRSNNRDRDLEPFWEDLNSVIDRLMERM